MRSKVIIAPLNWGLGHATRCIPVINSFLSKNWDVVIATDGEALDLLQKEFPALASYELPGYQIRYPYKLVFANMMHNLRVFSNGIRNEKRALESIIEKEKPDLLISDNRYGIFTDSCKSIFLGHQIRLKAGNPIFSYFGTKINRKLIRKFDELWIPDYENEYFSLAGSLSYEINGMPTQFIGPLSRFEKSNAEIKYELCAIISGPEPQRSIFQELLINQLSHLNEETVIVLGDLKENKEVMLNETTRVISHLTSRELNALVNSSDVIIARSGYSTIMDLKKIDKKAILIPTPGQTEQIYLAKHLSRQDGFVFQRQKKLDIPSALSELTKKNMDISEGRHFDVDDFLF